MDTTVRLRLYENSMGEVYCWTESHHKTQGELERDRDDRGIKFRWLTPEFTLRFGDDQEHQTGKARERGMRHDADFVAPDDPYADVASYFMNQIAPKTMNPIHPGAPIPSIHSKNIVEYARQRAAGEIQAGWWQWEYWSGLNATAWVPCDSQFDRHVVPLFEELVLYRCVMTDKHPNYAALKPKLKLIDMAKLPRGSVVVCAGDAARYNLHGFNNEVTGRINSEYGGVSQLVDVKKLRIAEQKTFTYWGGGECPVPDGVAVEFVRRSGQKLIGDMFGSGFWHHGGNPDRDVIAYRIIGVAPGRTDDSKAAG